MSKKSKKQKTQQILPPPAPEEQKVFSYTPNPNINLVLNGGQSTLDTATVPIEWHFSNELIAKRPQYIMICDHPDSLVELNNSTYYSFGVRHLFDVRTLVSYVQLHRAGRHCFIALVFYGDKKDALERAHKYTKKDNRYYNKSLYVHSVLINNQDNDVYSCEMTTVEFEVPPQLFSERPKSKFGQIIWAWVNRWCDTDPVDECAYRRRKIFAFTLQPILFLICRLLTGSVGTLYTAIGASILWFIGWRPIPVFANIAASWKSKGFKLELNRYCWWRVCKGWDETENGQDQYIPVSKVPAIITLDIIGAIVFITLVVWFVMNYGVIVIIMLGVVGLCALLGTILVKFFNSPDRRAKKKELKHLQAAKGVGKTKEQMLDEKLIKFLKQNAELSLTPIRVRVGVVIRKVNPVTKFILSYWATKAKVCKPFAK
ncbi:MAG: hypothetical protein ABIJ82_03470 [Patescibacteria group bacterium]